MTVYVSEDARHIDSCQYVRQTERVTDLAIVATSTWAVLCCAPLMRAPLSVRDATELARRVKAIADPTRLRLLSLIAAADREVCMCDLIAPVGLSQPTVSHHLKILVEGGLVSRDKRGVWVYYSLVPAALDSLSAVLSTEAAKR